MSTIEWILFALAVFTVLGAITVNIAILIIAYTQLDDVLEGMSKASQRYKRTAILSGPAGKMRLMAEISGIALFPKSALQLKTATAAEIESIPAPFTKKLAVIFYSTVLIFISGVLFVALK